MTSIQKIRNGLRRIDDGLGSFPPEDSHRGAEGAIQTLWKDPSSDDYDHPGMILPAKPMDDDESDDSDDDFKHYDFTSVFKIGPQSGSFKKHWPGMRAKESSKAS